MPAAIKSVEDHGYTLDIGLADVSGFVRFAETQGKRWKIGALLDVVVERLADDGRTCLFAFDGKVGNSLSVGVRRSRDDAVLSPSLHIEENIKRVVYPPWNTSGCTRHIYLSFRYHNPDLGLLRRNDRPLSSALRLNAARFQRRNEYTKPHSV